MSMILIVLIRAIFFTILKLKEQSLFSAFSVISSDPLSEDNVRQQSLFAFFIVWNIFTKTFKDTR